MLVFAALLEVFGKQADYIGIILFVCFCVCAIWVFVDMIVLNTQIAYAFGKGNWFAVGVVFLSAVFLCILAFSKNKYVGNPTGQEVKENML